MMLALLLALQSDPPEEVLEALRRTRAEPSYATAFKGGGGLRGAWIDKSGRARRPAAGLLLLEVQATGQKESVPAVRVGSRTWVYARLHRAWMAPDEASETGIAHGLANPDDLLSLIGEHAKFARREGRDLRLTVAGAEALALAKKIAGDQSWTDAEATIRLARDAEGRLSSVAVSASATNGQGKSKIEANVDLTYGKLEIPDRLGGMDFNADIKAAIEGHSRR